MGKEERGERFRIWQIRWPKNVVKKEKSDPNTRLVFNSLFLKNISFSYQNRKKIFSDYSLVLNAADKVCLSGASGIGKSTLIDIILGLIRIDSGEIKLNGYELNYNNINKFHKIIGYVPQKIFLFDSTIIKNIALDESQNFDSKRMELALKVSELNDFINTLPKALETKVGDLGSGFSGVKFKEFL